MVASLGVVSAAEAASVRFDSLEAVFQNATGGSNIVQTISYGDPASIRWGVTNGGPQSGYDFDAQDTPFTRVQDTVFGLGEFTHHNFPIGRNTGITSVELFVRANIVSVPDAGPDVSLGTSIFKFLIKHEETHNVAPCPYPGTSVCDDRVSISTLTSSDSVLIDGINYTLSILGFSETLADANNGIFNADFLSPEGGSNTRVLAATFAVDDRNIAPVPLPAGLPLLLASLGVLGLVRKRSKGA